MTSKYLYCEKCQDLIPESEAKNLSEIFPNLTVAGAVWTVPNDRLIHYYTRMENIYGNNPGVIGCCLEERPHYCGDVREASPEEYFILFTCNPKRNK